MLSGDYVFVQETTKSYYYMIATPDHVTAYLPPADSIIVTMVNEKKPQVKATSTPSPQQEELTPTPAPSSDNSENDQSQNTTSAPSDAPKETAQKNTVLSNTKNNQNTKSETTTIETKKPRDTDDDKNPLPIWAMILGAFITAGVFVGIGFCFVYCIKKKRIHKL